MVSYDQLDYAAQNAQLEEKVRKLYEISCPLGEVAIGDWNRLGPPVGGSAEPPPSVIKGGELVEIAYKGRPLPALFPGLGVGNILLPVSQARPKTTLQMAQGLALRWLASAEAGTVRMNVYDQAHTRAFNDFQGLGPRLFSNLGSDNIADALRRLVRLQEQVVSGMPIGTHDRPREVLVIVGGNNIAGQAQNDLCQLVAGGGGWGSVMCIGTEGLPTINTRLQRGSLGGFKYRADAPVTQGTIRRVVGGIAEASEARRKAPLSMEDFIASPLMKASAADGVEVAVGRREYHPEDGPSRAEDGPAVMFRLDGERPHGFFQGPSGTGKSNVLRMVVSALAAKYDPKELGLYLMDGAGPAFAVFAPNEQDESCLPHAHIIGSSIEPEAGLAVLQHLVDEVELRVDLMTHYNADNLAELREKDSEEREWPRLILFYDEIHTLLKSRVADEAVDLIDTLAREARKAAIHIVPVTQTLDGLSALWGNDSVIEDQLISRIGTPGSEIMSARDNREIADSLDEHRVVVNDRGGNKRGNRVAHVPYASSAATREITRKIWKARPENTKPPLILDAKFVPELEVTPFYQKLRPTANKPVSALVGLGFGLTKDDSGTLCNNPAAFRLDRSPGRNLAVIGSRAPDIARVFNSTAKSIAKQCRPGRVQFSMICCDQRFIDQANKLRHELARDNHEAQVYDNARDAETALKTIADGKQSGADQRDHYVLVYDANDMKPDESSFAQALKRVVDYGPPYGVHTIVSCARLFDLRNLLGGLASSLSAVGGYIGLDLNAKDAQSLTDRHTDGRHWRNAPNRAFFLDKKVGSEVVMLFQ